MGGLSAQERHVADEIARQERSTITASDIATLLEIPRSAASQILQQMTRKGWLLRVRRGLYTLVPLGIPTQAAVEDPWKNDCSAQKVFGTDPLE